MKKILFVTGLALLGHTVLFAQKYLTRTGQITFTASTPLETINPVNNESAGIIDAATGDVIFETLVKGFKFKIALMQEHFNENYMESDKYPKANFKGKFTDLSKINFGKDGQYQSQVSGKLTIHGVTKDVTMPATVKVNGTDLTVTSELKIAPEDYKISIPSLVRNKIAKQVQINVNAVMHKK